MKWAILILVVLTAGVAAIVHGERSALEAALQNGSSTREEIGAAHRRLAAIKSKLDEVKSDSILEQSKANAIDKINAELASVRMENDRLRAECAPLEKKVAEATKEDEEYFARRLAHSEARAGRITSLGVELAGIKNQLAAAKKEASGGRAILKQTQEALQATLRTSRGENH